MLVTWRHVIARRRCVCRTVPGGKGGDFPSSLSSINPLTFNVGKWSLPLSSLPSYLLYKQKMSAVSQSLHSLHKVQYLSGSEGKVHVLQATDHQISTVLGPDIIKITLRGNKELLLIWLYDNSSLSFWLIEGKILRVEMMLDLQQLKF